MRIGLISDTHGLLRPEAARALQGSERIIHAGDLCDPAILEALEKIAPVTAVRGNNDLGAWARGLKQTRIVKAQGARIFVIHDLAQMRIDPAAEGLHAVVSGHSHQPACERRGGVLFVNPGSAGPRRFSLPIGLGYLLVDGCTVEARLVEL